MRRWGNNIKLNLHKEEYGMDWIDLAQYTGRGGVLL
jgi:hypothetical protein